MTTLTDRLAAYVAAHPGAWIDGRDLAQIAGSYAWRTRISELRFTPYSLRIENRVRHVRAPDGRRVRVSEYRYQPDEAREHGELGKELTK